ncbi:MAG TPA: tetratricopeptide repeat protein, partial [Nitrososphaerales archaeon]|nr:tetratricopeptide repeat protein [Nitrososphaerales archaeon]
SALEAVRCAVEIQSRMRERNLMAPEARRVQMRIGIHVGDVVHAGGDILGDAVNVSSRIEPLAQAGGLCISGQVYDHVRNKLELRAELVEGKTLKNVKLPVAVYRIAMPWENPATEEAELDTKRLAVLPLKNMSPDPNDEYFADGMTEELITSLSTVRELTVIARTSVMQYKNTAKRISDIGRELGVGTLIEGSVRKAGSKVRITVQLIDARDEGHIWAQNYDKQLDDVFTVQSEVAERVAESLRVKLLEADARRLEKAPTRNPEAYSTYLKGMFFWAKRTPEGLRKAAELFEEAVRLDPTFALAYAGVAQAYSITAANHYADPEVYYPKAKEYALKALSLDDDLVEAHTVLASVNVGWDRDLAKAEAEFRRAIELNPNYATAHQWYSHILGWEKRFDEAREQIHKALELSPLSLIINANVVDSKYFDGDYEAGLERARKVIEMDPSFTTIYISLVRCNLGLGRLDGALQAVEAYSRAATPAEARAYLALVYAYMGRKEEAKKLLDEIEAEFPGGRATPFEIAVVWFKLGENDRGFEWLEKAYDHHDRYVFMMAIAKELDGVRSDPRYLAMMKKTGLEGSVRT